MTTLPTLSDQRWAAFLETAGATLTRWGFRPRPVGIPVHTDALALCAEGLGSLAVYRGGQLDYGSHWLETSRPCGCTDGGRNAPRINCRGEGLVTP